MNAINLVTSNTASSENYIPIRKRILKSLLFNIPNIIALYWDGICIEKAPSGVKYNTTLVPDI